MLRTILISCSILLWGGGCSTNTYPLLGTITDSKQECQILRHKLAVIQSEEISGYDQDNLKYKNDLVVIDAIRRLQYLTGKKFYSSTRTPLTGDRAYWLTQRMHNEEIPFFSVWSSRDSIFIAPADAQSAIIKKWENFLDGEFNINVNNTLEFWYF